MHPNQSCRYRTNFRFTRLSGFCFFLFALYSSASFAASTTEMLHLDEHECQLSIDHVRATQDPPQQQVRRWSKVSLPDQWEKRWPGYSGSVWYQINWTQRCDPVQTTPIALGIHGINMAGEVYLNQQLLWKDRSRVEPLSRSWNTPRYWILAPTSFHAGQNQLDIKVIGVATQAPGLGEVHLGQADAIISKHENYVFFHRTLFFVNLITSITLGLVALVIWLLRRKDSTFGWFALTSFTWALFLSNTLSLDTYPFSNTLQLAKFNSCLLMVYSLCLVTYSWRFAGKKFKKIESVLWGLALIFTALVYLTPNAHLQLYLFIAFIYAVLLFLGNCIGFQWIALQSKQPEVHFLALVFLLYIVICVHDVSRILQLDYNGTYLTPFSAPLMALAISLILAWRIARNINKIENFNEQLEHKIDQVKLELQQSLDNKYQLEIDNVRLQERINLSHELHDGLGGSLVRSMFLVDKAEEFDKQRFMSILKLLRNDLRQIIDSGSSIGVAVPESPVVWIAPLRRRFVEIFDEMDIESHWDIPEHWPVQPTALEYLTMARVTEETLTNVLKHSRAKQVTISLSSHHEHDMALRIEDDGIGFNLNEIETGLHVGLHSMQIRVQRIGGILNIQSQPGKTMIEVILCRHKHDLTNES